MSDTWENFVLQVTCSICKYLYIFPSLCETWYQKLEHLIERHKQCFVEVRVNKQVVNIIFDIIFEVNKNVLNFTVSPCILIHWILYTN